MSRSILAQLLTGDISPEAVSFKEWTAVIEQGRSAQVLGSLYGRFKQRGELSRVPPDVRRHLLGQFRLSEKQKRDALSESERLLPAFAALDAPLILLKGAAYVIAQYDFAHGRQFSDIDLLIQRQKIEQLEASLHWYGWSGTHQNAYDQRYYRQWMHEIPPLVHKTRGTVIDIHHTLLPLTARLKPDAQKLFDDAQAIPTASTQTLYSLSLSDQLLHCATHLFLDSELDHAFRDLLDFDGLLRLWASRHSDWNTLIARAHTLDLSLPLFLAMRHSRRIFDTPSPQWAEEASRPDSLSNGQLKRLDWLYQKALVPHHPSCLTFSADIAKFYLFVRGHYMRMPFHTLFLHIFHKLFVAKKTD